MPLAMPSLTEVDRESWDRAHAIHHLNEIERQIGLLEFHTARVAPTQEGRQFIDAICARLSAIKETE